MEELDRKVITISSSNCNSLNNYTDFNGKTRSDTSSISCALDFTMTCKQDEEFRATMSYISLPLSFYNVNSTNNKIVITGHSVSTANGMYTITQGYYSVDELVTALTNTDTTADQRVTSGTVEFGDYFTVTYNTQQNILYFKCTTSTTAVTIDGNTTAYSLLGMPYDEDVTFTTNSDNYTKTFEITSSTLTIDSSNYLLSISGHSNSNYNGTYTIPSSYYGTVTPATFITAINNSVNTKGYSFKSGINCSYYTDTDGYYWITYTTESSTTPSFGSSNIIGEFYNCNNSTTYPFSSTTTYFDLYSPVNVNINYSNVFHICSSKLGTNNVSSYGNDVLVTVYTSDTPPSIVTFQSYDEIKLRTKIIDSFDMQIRDEKFNIVSLNGVNWTMSMLLKKYKKPTDTMMNDLSLTTKRHVHWGNENVKRQKN